MNVKSALGMQALQLTPAVAVEAKDLSGADWAEAACHDGMMGVGRVKVMKSGLRVLMLMLLGLVRVVRKTLKVGIGRDQDGMMTMMMKVKGLYYVARMMLIMMMQMRWQRQWTGRARTRPRSYCYSYSGTLQRRQWLPSPDPVVAQTHGPEAGSP
jgi:hypothetical protein